MSPSLSGSRLAHIATGAATPSAELLRRAAALSPHRRAATPSAIAPPSRLVSPVALPPSRPGSPVAPPPRHPTIALAPRRPLGTVDIRSVYLAEVKGKGGSGSALVAAKVMDRKELAGRNKEGCAHTEREILEAVDHPFLPRLYGLAEGDRWSCLLTEFCPGGDLHILRQRQPHRRFSKSAVRWSG
ncbi:hypothetical protein E2562_026292 [Oryza meyeriana var. granulata]|uniref:non-specific serine/threonine protein kinase n=1 Tax=Oryza meyeriana var. granulata TaxID=110450 RepID=A0A6G1C7Z1_9ORYZ|nr:hypothetical protein E2562_026292 [Oryza meyeriana var. granulata]